MWKEWLTYEEAMDSNDARYEKKNVLVNLNPVSMSMCMCEDDQSLQLIMPNAKEQRGCKESRDRERDGVGGCVKCKQDRRREKETMIGTEEEKETGRGCANLYIKEPSDLTRFNTT